MASTINADDGVISGSAGVKTTPDASGILDLQTNGTTAVTIQSDRRVQINGSNTLATTLVATSNTFPLNNAASAYQYRANCTLGTANIGAVGFGSTYRLPATGAFGSSYQFYADNLDTGGATLTNNFGVYVASQTVGTNIYGVYSNIASGTNRYNFYANGTADNYFEGAVQVNGNLQFNSGFGSVATAYGCRAWVTFDGTSTGTWPGGASTVTRISGSTTATVTTTTAHGLVTGGTVQALTGVVAGTYVVTYISATQFSFTTAATTALTNASITFAVVSITTSGNVSSIADIAAGRYAVNFTTAMPDANYAMSGSSGNATGTTTSARSVTRDGAWTAGSCLIRNLAASTTQDDTFISIAIFR